MILGQGITSIFTELRLTLSLNPLCLIVPGNLHTQTFLILRISQLFLSLPQLGNRL